MTPEVIYEDNHIIVVVKPFGMPSQEDDSKDLDMLSFKVFKVLKEIKETLVQLAM